MNKLRRSTTFLLFSLLLGLLAACGGETPTATPVPAPPTSTIAPPTATTLPPSPTTAPATATTVAVVEPTETQPELPTSVPLHPVGGGAATATRGTGTGAAATSTTSAGTGTAATPTAAATAAAEATPPAGTPVASADMDLIREAMTKTTELQTYHFTMSATGAVFTAPVQIEGDYVAPDKAYIKGTAGGEQIEQVIWAGKAYQRQGSAWVPVAEPTPDTSGVTVPNPAADLTSSANILQGLAPLADAGTQYQDRGTETVNGVSTRHFAADITTSGMMGGAGNTSGIPDMNLGSVELWIDPGTQYLHKLKMNLDLAAFFNLMSAAFGQLAGTPEPGTPTATPLPSVLDMHVDMTISKQNDPSITVPDPTK